MISHLENKPDFENIDDVSIVEDIIGSALPEIELEYLKKHDCLPLGIYPYERRNTDVKRNLDLAFQKEVVTGLLGLDKLTKKQAVLFKKIPELIASSTGDVDNDRLDMGSSTTDKEAKSILEIGFKRKIFDCLKYIDKDLVISMANGDWGAMPVFLKFLDQLKGGALLYKNSRTNEKQALYSTGILINETEWIQHDEDDRYPTVKNAANKSKRMIYDKSLGKIHDVMIRFRSPAQSRQMELVWAHSLSDEGNEIPSPGQREHLLKQKEWEAISDFSFSEKEITDFFNVLGEVQRLDGLNNIEWIKFINNIRVILPFLKVNEEGLVSLYMEPSVRNKKEDLEMIQESEQLRAQAVLGDCKERMGKLVFGSVGFDHLPNYSEVQQSCIKTEDDLQELEKKIGWYDNVAIKKIEREISKLGELEKKAKEIPGNLSNRYRDMESRFFRLKGDVEAETNTVLAKKGNTLKGLVGSAEKSSVFGAVSKKKIDWILGFLKEYRASIIQAIESADKKTSSLILGNVDQNSFKENLPDGEIGDSLEYVAEKYTKRGLSDREKNINRDHFSDLIDLKKKYNYSQDLLLEKERVLVDLKTEYGKKITIVKRAIEDRLALEARLWEQAKNEFGAGSEVLSGKRAEYLKNLEIAEELIQYSRNKFFNRGLLEQALTKLKEIDL